MMCSVIKNERVHFLRYHKVTRQLSRKKGRAKMKIPCNESMGTCPKCGSVVNITVELAPGEVLYHGICPEHGKFTRKEVRADMSELGQKISSTVGIKNQVSSIA